jgi:cobyric acid synthase
MENGHSAGCWCGNVYGSYLHAFLRHDACRGGAGGSVPEKGRATPAEAFDYKSYKGKQYDAMADGVRRHWTWI